MVAYSSYFTPSTRRRVLARDPIHTATVRSPGSTAMRSNGCDGRIQRPLPPSARAAPVRSLDMGCDGRIQHSLPPAADRLPGAPYVGADLRSARAGAAEIDRRGDPPPAAPAGVDLKSTPTDPPAAPARAAGSLGMGCDGRIQHTLPPGVVSLPAWRLRNGNVPFDLRRSRRCGARTRAGCPCRQPAMANGRCRLHGGQSTGARTAAGRERCRHAPGRHGGGTLAYREMRKEGMRIRRNLRILCALAVGEIARREGRWPPAEYLRLLDATGKSPAELLADVEANHWAAVRQGEATRRRQAAEARSSPYGGERLAA